jgi:hypothetical protein
MFKPVGKVSWTPEVMGNIEQKKESVKKGSLCAD